MDRHSSYTVPRSDRSGCGLTRLAQPKTQHNNGRSGNEKPVPSQSFMVCAAIYCFQSSSALSMATASSESRLTVGNTTDYKTVDVSLLKVKSHSYPETYHNPGIPGY